MSLDDADRRSQPRIELVRPCKVYDPRSRRYLSGATWNVSRGGILVELDRPVPLIPRDRLFVGLATRRREVVLCRSEMIASTVTRSLLTPNDRTVVGLCLDEPLEIQGLRWPIAQAA